MARITGCIEHGKGAYVDFIDEPGFGSTEFIVFRARAPLTPEVVFFYTRLEALRDHAMASMTGSSGRQRVPVDCFGQFKIAVPPDARPLEADFEVIRSCVELSRSLWRESATLAELEALDDLPWGTFDLVTS